MTRTPRPLPPLLILLIACAFGLPGLAAGAAATAGPSSGPGSDPWQACAREASAAERAADLPPHLLGAIAKVESGRWSAPRQARIAWPWTVMAEGRGRFLPSRDAAIAEVKRLRARGVGNIDVGCMQVNLRYHPRAFGSLEAAFDPRRNVAYAAAYLRRLRAEAGSWTVAIGRYHSRTPRLSGAYRLKVFRAWRAERHLANQARIAGRKAESARAAQLLPRLGRHFSATPVAPTKPGAIPGAGHP